MVLECRCNGNQQRKISEVSNQQIEFTDAGLNSPRLGIQAEQSVTGEPFCSEKLFDTSLKLFLSSE